MFFEIDFFSLDQCCQERGLLGSGRPGLDLGSAFSQL